MKLLGISSANPIVTVTALVRIYVNTFRVQAK